MSIADVFVHFPQLETRRLVLRQIRPTDAEAFFAFFSDPEVVTADEKRHRSLEESVAFIGQLQHWYATRENVQWGITLRGEDVLLGTCGFYAFDKGFHHADIGYELLKTRWRQGIMSEALTAILTFAFTTMELHRVDAVVHEGNERSQGILQKLGFTREGTLRQRYFSGERFLDEYHFGLLKDEWLGR